MPVKLRVAKDRRPEITSEVLALFVALERVPKRQRHQQEWRDRSKQLARLLGLTIEWWSMNHVHDTGGPCGPEPARQAWKTCREMRVRLLAAVRLRHVDRGQALEPGDHARPLQ
jgi:hypothetical protein